MKTFKVRLERAYEFEVSAQSAEKAREYAEFYIGDPADCSTETIRQDQKFKISSDMELVRNEAYIIKT